MQGFQLLRALFLLSEGGRQGKKIHKIFPKISFALIIFSTFGSQIAEAAKIKELNLSDIQDSENGASAYRKAFKILDSIHNEKYTEVRDYLPHLGIVRWDKAVIKRGEKWFV